MAYFDVMFAMGKDPLINSLLQIRIGIRIILMEDQATGMFYFFCKQNQVNRSNSFGVTRTDKKTHTNALPPGARLNITFIYSTVL